MAKTDKASKEKPAAKKRGKPKGSGLLHDPKEQIQAICEWLSEGKTLASYCKQEGKPKYASVWRWCDENPSFADSIARARDIGEHVISEDCFAIADQMPPTDENGRTDSGFVAWQKNRIWTRTQLLAKWNPKKWGDKLQHSGDSAQPVSINIVRFSEGEK